MRSTRLEIDLNNIRYNIKTIKDYLGEEIEIMFIVKANGYGTHLNYCSDLLNEFNYVGVALLDEAILLRKNGYKNKIFILYPLNKEEYKIALKYNFIINGSNIFDIIDESNKSITIHLELETGMGRTGLQESKLLDYINKLKNNKNIILEGLFTHLSSSGSNKEFSFEQINRFEKMIKILNDNNIYFKYKHICCSGGLINYKDYLYNMVRIGLLIYGYYPNDSLKNNFILKPCMKLKTKITYIKELKKGDTVGYNKNFIAKKKTKVATIPFGFADGLLGLETGAPYVIVNKKKAKIIGICMDNMIIDITNIDNVNLDNDVYIWDNDYLTIDEVGIWCNGICNYEVMTSISERVPREFIN